MTIDDTQDNDTGLSELKAMWANSEEGSMRRYLLEKQIKRITGNWPQSSDKSEDTQYAD